MTVAEKIAALLDPALGEHLDDVAFADLVDDVLVEHMERVGV
jgi:hypothetical protein